MAKKKYQYYKNICFTDYRCRELFKINENYCTYYIYQREKCPTTGRLHWQGYIELKKRMSYEHIKNKVLSNNETHVEQRKGSQEQAIQYCMKSESQVEECIEWGTPNDEQGKRHDLDELAELAPFHSAKWLVETFGGNALRHIHMIKSYQKCIYKPDDMEMILQQMDSGNYNDKGIAQKDFMIKTMDLGNMRRGLPCIAEQISSITSNSDNSEDTASSE